MIEFYLNVTVEKDATASIKIPNLKYACEFLRSL